MVFEWIAMIVAFGIFFGTIIEKYIEDYNVIENYVLEINSKISTYEAGKNNSQALIDKIKSLINSYRMFIDITKKKKKIYIY